MVGSDAIGGKMHPLSYCRFLVVHFVKDKFGAVATEYAFVIAFIAIVAAAGMSVFGGSLNDFFTGVGSALSEMVCKMPDTASDKADGKSNKCKDKEP